MKRFAILLLALAAVPAGPAGAADLSGLPEPLVTDRPDFTESTATVAPGHVQVEAGATLARVEEEDSDTFGEVLVRIGLGPRLEARLGAGSYSRTDGPGGEISGREDPAVGVKVRLTGDAAELAPGLPAVSLLLGTSVPMGDDELTSDAWEPEAKLAFGWEVTSWLSLSANVNAAYLNDPAADDRFTQLSASLSAGFPLTDRLGAFAEVYGFSEEEPDGPSTRYVNGGVTWLFGNDLQLDARVGWGLNDADPEWFAGVGAGLRF